MFSHCVGSILFDFNCFMVNKALWFELSHVVQLTSRDLNFSIKMRWTSSDVQNSNTHTIYNKDP